MAKSVYVVLGLILSVSVFLSLTVLALHQQSYDLSYFESSFLRYEIPGDMQVELQELMSYASLLVEYLKGNIDSPNTHTTARGRDGLLYGEREIIHLEDVRDLFDLSRAIQRVSAFLSMLIVAAAIWKRETRAVARGALLGGLGIVCLLGLTALVVATDFERYFIIFHELSFSNDLWMLDPDTEFLIRMFPEQFFAGVAARTALALAAYYAGFLAISFTAVSPRAWTKKGRTS